MGNARGVERRCFLDEFAKPNQTAAMRKDARAASGLCDLGYPGSDTRRRACEAFKDNGGAKRFRNKTGTRFS